MVRLRDNFKLAWLVVLILFHRIENGLWLIMACLPDRHGATVRRNFEVSRDNGSPVQLVVNVDRATVHSRRHQSRSFGHSGRRVFIIPAIQFVGILKLFGWEACLEGAAFPRA